MAKCLCLHNKILIKTIKLSVRSIIYTRQIWYKILSAPCDVWAVQRRTASIPWSVLFCGVTRFVSF